MKPMIFQADEPFQQLRDEGEVVTFRSEEKQPGDVWIRRERTGEKKFDAEVTATVKIHPSRYRDLQYHVNRSDFDSVEQWQQKIKELHGELKPGYLHHVMRK